MSDRTSRGRGFGPSLDPLDIQIRNERIAVSLESLATTAERIGDALIDILGRLARLVPRRAKGGA